MRAITNEARKKLNQQFGSEPLFVLGINWSGNTISYYADKSVYDESGTPFILGKILDINNIESILNIDGNNSSVSIDVTLSDEDESFLNLFNNVDVHRRPAYLFQYFDGLHIEDMFLLFQGYVVSDIVWNDKDKTFKIAIVSMAENYEAGFSPESGEVAKLREDLTGKPWPMGFGTVYKCPTARITDIPIGVTTEPLGIHDWWLSATTDRLDLIHADLVQIALFYLLAALQAYNSEDFTTGDQMTELGNSQLLLADEIKGQRDGFLGMLTEQLSFDKTNTYVLTDYPINLKGMFEVGGNYLIGTMKAAKNGISYFTFDHVYHQFVNFGTHPSQEQIRHQELEGASTFDITTLLEGPITRGVNNFVYIPAGSQIRFLGDYPVRYVVNIIPSEILHVYANRTFEGVTRRMLVPKSYYKKVTVVAQSSSHIPSRTFQCTGIRFFRPLSTLFNQHWSDEVFVTFKSSIGPSFQSVIRYIIRTFTIYGIDGTSLNEIPPFNVNFALLEVKDVLTLIQEICYQCKVAVIFKQGKFYFKYLPRHYASIGSITLQDILEDSLEFSFIHTENLMTKSVGNWRFDWSDPKQNIFVIRYNVAKYGTLEEIRDFYVFNVQKAVEASMSFWLYRRGNSWKRLKIQVPLKWLIAENYDIVTLNEDFTKKYGINGGNSVDAVILNTIYDPTNNLLNLELEIPIKLGQNRFDKNYWPSGDFQWMGSGAISQIYNHIYPDRFWNGVDYTPLAQLGPLAIGVFGDQTEEGHIGVTDVSFDNAHQSLDLPSDAFWDMLTQNPPAERGQISPSRSVSDIGGTLGDYIAPQVNFPENPRAVNMVLGGASPTWPLGYRDPTTQSPTGSSALGGGIPAKIKSGKGTKYTITLYEKGPNQRGTDVQATCLQIDANDTIPKDTFVMATSINVSRTAGADAQTVYYFVVPIWL